MRVYKQNDKGEKLYYLECTSFNCRYAATSDVITVWSKDHPIINCEKCGCLMIETMDTWQMMPQTNSEK